MRFKKNCFWSLVLIAVIGTICLASDNDAQSGDNVIKDKEAVPIADSASAQKDTSVADSIEQVLDKIVVYYFHGTRRCAKCRKMEAYSKEAIEEAFGDKLNEGSMEWYAINTDEKENNFYDIQYKLYANSLIVSKIEDGEETEWKNLEKIWQLVSNKEEFYQYVQNEVMAYMGSN